MCQRGAPGQVGGTRPLSRPCLTIPRCCPPSALPPPSPSRLPLPLLLPPLLPPPLPPPLPLLCPHHAPPPLARTCQAGDSTSAKSGSSLKDLFMALFTNLHKLTVSLVTAAQRVLALLLDCGRPKAKAAADKMLQSSVLDSMMVRTWRSAGTTCARHIYHLPILVIFLLFVSCIDPGREPRINISTLAQRIKKTCIWCCVLCF